MRWGQSLEHTNGDHLVPVFLAGGVVVLDAGDRRWPTWRFHNAISPNALGAHPDPAHFAVHDRTHPLQVRVPPPIRFVVRVADIVTVDRSLATDFTNACHDFVPGRLLCERVVFPETGDER